MWAVEGRGRPLPACPRVWPAVTASGPDRTVSTNDSPRSPPVPLAQRWTLCAWARHYNPWQGTACPALLYLLCSDPGRRQKKKKTARAGEKKTESRRPTAQMPYNLTALSPSSLFAPSFDSPLLVPLYPPPPPTASSTSHEASTRLLSPSFPQSLSLLCR